MLRKLGMIDGEGVVTVKGRAACEIDTADELLTTEMMFNGTFNGLDKHQLVALVSCLVPGEKSQVWACLCQLIPMSSLIHSILLAHSFTHFQASLVPDKKSQVWACLFPAPCLSLRLLLTHPPIHLLHHNFSVSPSNLLWTMHAPRGLFLAHMCIMQQHLALKHRELVYFACSQDMEEGPSP